MSVRQGGTSIALGRPLRAGKSGGLLYIQQILYDRRDKLGSESGKLRRHFGRLFRKEVRRPRWSEACRLSEPVNLRMPHPSERKQRREYPRSALQASEWILSRELRLGASPRSPRPSAQLGMGHPQSWTPRRPIACRVPSPAAIPIAPRLASDNISARSAASCLDVEVWARSTSSLSSFVCGCHPAQIRRHVRTAQ